MRPTDYTAVELTLFGYTFRVDFWKDTVAYEAVERDTRVFIREQRHRFLPVSRRKVYRPPNGDRS